MKFFQINEKQLAFPKFHLETYKIDMFTMDPFKVY